MPIYSSGHYSNVLKYIRIWAVPLKLVASTYVIGQFYSLKNYIRYIFFNGQKYSNFSLYGNSLLIVKKSIIYYLLLFSITKTEKNKKGLLRVYD